jgi:hypothetical protein
MLYVLFTYILRGYYLLFTGLQVLVRLRIYIIMVKMQAFLPFRKKDGNKYLSQKLFALIN